MYHDQLDGRGVLSHVDLDQRVTSLNASMAVVAASWAPVAASITELYSYVATVNASVDNLQAADIYINASIDTLQAAVVNINGTLDDVVPGRLDGYDYGWDDVVVLTDSVRLPTSQAPSYQTWKTSQQLLRFQAAGGEYVHFTVQLPHSRKPSSDLFWHVHFVPQAAISTGSTVTFQLVYNAVTPNAVAGVNGTVNSTYVASATVAIDTHAITVSATIDGDALGASSIIVCRMARLSADTFAGNAYLLGTDFHFQRSRLGSRLENGTA